jgi:hypothetical protein
MGSWKLNGWLCALVGLLLLMPASAAAQTVFAFSSAEGDWVGQGETRTFTPANATFSVNVPDYDPQQVSIYVNTPDEVWSISLAVPKGQAIAPGRHVDAERTSFRTGRSPGIDVGGAGRGCNQTWGSFNVRQVHWTPDGQLAGLEADFIQRCESATAPPLAGVIRWKAPQLSLSLGGALLGPGLPATFHGDTSVFELYGDTAGLAYYGSGKRRDWWIMITPPTGKPLQVGQYVTNTEATATRAGVAINGLSRCWTTTGKLDIKRMTVHPDGTVSAIYATFEQRCAGVPGALTGTIHYRL